MRSLLTDFTAEMPRESIVGQRSYTPLVYILDPDGNNIEAYWYGSTERLAEGAVFTTPEG